MVATDGRRAIFKVIDALDHPHGGRILRLRLQQGDAPSVRELKGARLRATSPDGEERILVVEDFALTGGKASDERLARTGRADLHVYAADDRAEPPVTLEWTITGPIE